MDSTNIESKTLWLGDLEPFIDQSFLTNLVISLGYGQHLASVKVIKDKHTGLSSKYGFAEFTSHKIAEKFMQENNGKPMPNAHNKYFKIKWASYGGGVKPNTITSTFNEISIYVGDLDGSVNEPLLLEYFKNQYSSVFSSKIITDPTTKQSKGYGFVKFTNHEEAQKAILENNGKSINGRQMKVSHAYMKNKDDGPKEEEENQQTQAAKRIKIYQQYYSMLNDPILKADYEKEMEKMFGKDVASNKMDVKSNLEAIKTFSYKQTQSSEKFLNTLPKMIAHHSKQQIENQIFN